ncbi:type II toxin-antitoxin system Phd/YefM family antitoxin [Clostridium tyrobutyricum]|uniref:type II toxin-antitoxin system Phd/YefM family antitoxin n=1 Tax=Clostridium tyrobutyricum TaxID=1519 RepID=UPI001C384841|nr:type II toxin-antitoxin system Phd/YefM family antitoxin [Clostridium tyrobutyricum]MBV4432634.1 type II toxin-antitoxin system Phd/YefM family antitoxin [Clostridium tyrobutyricum]
MSAVIDTKPKITKDQIVKSSVVSKRLGQYRRKAKENPIYISDNGNIDTVILSYDQFEKMYERLAELEEKEEERIIGDRIKQIEKHPELSAKWKDIRRNG